MKYEIRCESCGGIFKLEGIESGEIVVCPHCGVRIRLQATSNGSGGNERDGGSGEGERFWPELVPPEEIDKPSDSTIIVTPSAEDTAKAKAEGTLDEAYDPDVEFRRDLVRFIVPCRTAGEVPTLALIVILFLIWPFLNMFSFFCCLNWLIQLALVGSFCAFFAEIITETARGQDQLPYFGSIAGALENFWSDIVVPTLNFICAIIYCQIPGIAGSGILMMIDPPREVPVSSGMEILDPNAVGLSPGSTTLVWSPVSEVILTVLVIAGMFFLPMVFLILAFDKIQLLLRPDKIWEAIRTILKPYLIGWLAILIGVGLFWVSSRFFPEPEAEQYYLGNRWHLAAVIPLLIVDTLVFLYAMRVVGLLYRHYEPMLPWRLYQEKKHPLEEG